MATRMCNGLAGVPLHRGLLPFNRADLLAPRASSPLSLSSSPSRSMTSSTLKSARVALRKRFGQHLLRNPDVVRAIIDAADIQPGESVFEIGPGSGNMTIFLLEKAKAVFAVELDTRLAEIVTRRVNELGYGHKFFLTRADFLTVPLPSFDRLVANIPYQISSPVMQRLFTHTPPCKAAVIMFQLEFAQRIVAQPGTKDYSRLSVNSQLLSHSVRMVMKIGREQFNPPPKVDSAVVEIVPKGIPAGLDFPRWDCFLRIAFAGKNKRLRSVLVNKHVLAQLASDKGSSVPTAPSSVSSSPSLSPLAASARRFSTSALSALGAAFSKPQGKGKAAPPWRPTAAAFEDDDDEDDVVGVAPAGDDDDDDEELSSSTTGGHGNDDVVRTSVGPFRRQQLLDVRAKVDAVIESLGAQEWRPNGMTVKQFLAAFEALEKAGLRFPPIKERVYPSAPSPFDSAVASVAADGNGVKTESA